jgi:hypothetical protein
MLLAIFVFVIVFYIPFRFWPSLIPRFATQGTAGLCRRSLVRISLAADN